jgi:hypothetical protein
MIANKIFAKIVHKAKRSVIDGEAEHGHIIRVQNAVAKAVALPQRGHLGCPVGDLLKPGQINVRLRQTQQMREVEFDDVIGQLGDQFGLEALRGAALVADLEGAEAEERGGHSQHNGALLVEARAVLVGVAQGRVVGHDDGSGARGWDAQSGQRLAAEELADRRAQHGLAVREPRKRRQARALELQLEELVP